MISKADAILTIKSDAKISTDQDNKVIWHDGNPTNITDKQIEDKQKELQTAYDNKKYQRDRKAEYPNIVDQLDDIYHNGIDGWKTTIKTTKDKFPK
tara:strand:- start:65 stop:352 length:288 start_codon:yes stop_codon:yes gene_type:complete